MPTPGLDLAFLTVDDNKVTTDLERIKAWSLLIQTAIDDVVTGAVPTGPAGGELSGTYPDPTIANGVIDNANVSNTAAIAYSKLALTLGIVNGDISASAAIAYSKLNLSGSIVNADVATGAAIAYAKLNLAGAVTNADLAGSIAQSKITNLASDLALLAPLASPALTGNPTAPTQTAGNNSTRIATTAYADTAATAVATPDASSSVKGKIQLAGALTGTSASPAIANLYITTAMIAPSGIDYAKLNLTGSIGDGDINAAAGIAYSKLNLSSSITSADLVNGTIVNADVNASAAIAESKLDTNVARRNADNTIAGNVIASKATTGSNPVVSGTTSSSGQGVSGTSSTGAGVVGTSTSGKGVAASSGSGVALEAISTSGGAGVNAVNMGANPAILAENVGTGSAIDAYTVSSAAAVQAYSGSTGPAFKVITGHGTGAAFDANGEGKIINVVDPTAAQDAATKTYVDTAVAAGITFGTPGTILPDDAANAGTGTTAARANHTHAIAAAAASTITPASTNTEGSATSFARSDHTHAITSATAGSIQPNDAAATGTAASVARSDHKHSIVTAAASTLTGTNAEGSATSFARSDHNHALPAMGTYFQAPISGNAANLAITAGTLYFAQIYLPTSATLTGLIVGSGSATGNLKALLFDSSGANLKGGTSTAVAASVKKYPFASTYAAAPGVYIVAVIGDSTPTLTRATGFSPTGTNATGSFASPPASVTPSTAAGDFNPVISTY